MKPTYFLAALFLIFVSFSVTASNSLWSEDAADFYQDEVNNRNFSVGDIVTIVIEETANAVQSANTSTSQESNVDGGPGGGLFDFLKAFGFSYSDQGSADGQTKQSGTLKADITTVVKEITDSGNLKIEGTKQIKINGEQQTITLSGIIRPKDVSEENTVTSKKVAEANIDYQGKGVVADKQKPGLLEKFFNFIF